MAGDAVPDDVREFILRYIDSIAQLEALLLLRANSDRSWNVESVARRLYTSERQVSDLLARMHQDRFLISDGAGYRYDCVDADQRNVVDRLAETYTTHLIPITNMIHDKPRRLREFADAFKLRKDR